MRRRKLWRFLNLTGGLPEPTPISRWRVELSLLGDRSFNTLLSADIEAVSGLQNTSGGMSQLHNLNASSPSPREGGNYSYSSVADFSTLDTTSGNFTAVDRSLSVEHYILILLYTATTILAIVGNSIAIAIFAKGKRSKSDLRPFLINLAVADLIMAIFCIPFTFTYELLGNWVFSAPMCPIVMFLQTVSVTGSVSTNMAIGIDRFTAITFPLKSRVTSSKYRIIILIIWIISTGLTAVLLFVGKTDRNPYTKMIECREEWPHQQLAFTYTILLLVLTYIVPVIILTVTYSVVGYILWKRNLPGNADAMRDQAQLKSKLKIVKMLATVVVLFALCWLPLHTFFFILNFLNKDDYPRLHLAYFLCHWLAMSNSFVNPIIYGSLNDSFRADLKTLVFRLIPCQGGSGNSRHGAVKFKRRPGMPLTQQNSCSSAEYTSKAFLTPEFQSEWQGNGSSLVRTGFTRCSSVSRS